MRILAAFCPGAQEHCGRWRAAFHGSARGPSRPDGHGRALVCGLGRRQFWGQRPAGHSAVVSPGRGRRRSRNTDVVGGGVAGHGERRAPRRVSGLTSADHLRIECLSLSQPLGVHLILDVSHLAIGFVCRHVGLSACRVHNALQHILG